MSYDLEMWQCENIGSPKKSKSGLPDNSYVRRIPKTDYEEYIQKQGPGSGGLDTLHRDLARTWKDYKNEEAEEARLQLLEDKAKKALLRWRELNQQKKDNLQLTDVGEQLLTSCSEVELEADYEAVKTKRYAAGKTKEQLLDRNNKIKREINARRQQKGSTIAWYDPSRGEYYMRWGSASVEASQIQSNKRSKEVVGNEYYQLLATADGLLKISWETSIKLVEEYQNLFDTYSKDYDLMNKIIRSLEKNRYEHTRETFAWACYESLSTENQLEYERAKRIILSNPERKYEFQLPVDRTKRMEKLKRDGKTPGELRRKEAIKEFEASRRYDRVTRQKAPFGFNRQRRGNMTRGRGRGSFRGSNRPPFQNRYPSYQSSYNTSFGGRGRGRGRGQGRGAFQAYGTRPQYFNNFQRPQFMHNRQPAQLALQAPAGRGAHAGRGR